MDGACAGARGYPGDSGGSGSGESHAGDDVVDGSASVAEWYPYGVGGGKGRESYADDSAVTGRGVYVGDLSVGEGANDAVVGAN